MIRGFVARGWTARIGFLILVLATSLEASSADVSFSDWLATLRKDALASGVRASTLDAALTDIRPVPRVLELDRKQPEFTLTFQEYMTRVVPEARVQLGKQKLRDNRALLEEIGRKYGVQPRFIVAFWGIESDFGRLTGGFPVVESLATLAYDGRRSAFFRKELLNALKILDEGHIAPKTMIGSWAGAMGMFQFMPSSFLAYAVDYNGDGRKDLWNDRADGFASSANYLARSGWRPDQTWGRWVQAPKAVDPAVVGLGVKKTLSEWQAMGVRRQDGGDIPSRSDVTASLVFAEGPGSAAFLVYANYQTILKWNRSTFFAVAVGSLADRIGDG
ncbi:MAG: lytic murein transglycosylase [Rhodospirillales bacterium]|nr:lytic murein transglycosylase [Rhodospirillales bacterium]